MTDHLKLDGEVSVGDLGGIGGKIGTTYLQSDRTSMYMNYVVEDERIDNQFTSTGGRQGSLVTGMKTRFTDTSSLFAEERYRNGNSLSGLTHAAGVRRIRPQHMDYLISCRTSAAASHIAFSLPNAVARGKYFMPQSGASTSRSGAT